MVLSVSTDRIWLRMTEAMGHPEWATDPRYRQQSRAHAHADEVDALVGGWFAAHTAEEAQRILDEAGVPVCPIYSIADIFADPQYPARGGHHLRRRIRRSARCRCPRVLPRFSRTPGGVRFVGPPLGEHNAEIYGGLLGLSQNEQDDLRNAGVI